MQRMAGQSAAAAVIDVTNGDIVALASAPGFEANSFVFGIKSGEWNGLLNDDYRPLANKTITGTYPPGSTFKICMALAALEAGVVSPGDGVGCAGGTYLGGRRFHCWKARRARAGRPAAEPRAVLRLLLLRDGPPARAGPDQRHGAHARARGRARPADPGGLRPATCPTPPGRRRSAASPGRPATASTTGSARGSRWPRPCSSR